VLAHNWQTIPKKGKLRSRERLVGTNHTYGTAEYDKVVKFCIHVGYIKSQQMDDKSSLKGAWSESCGPF